MARVRAGSPTRLPASVRPQYPDRLHQGGTHHWVLTQQNSVGLHSPTIARRKDFRRQTKDQLATVVRKHFNGLGVQENDIIVDFLHKVKNPGVAKTASARKTKHIPQESDR